MESCSSTKSNKPLPAKQIIILSGQSNMAGRGCFENKHWFRQSAPRTAKKSSGLTLTSAGRRRVSLSTTTSTRRRRGAGDAVRQRGQGARGDDRAGALRRWQDRYQGVGAWGAPLREYGETRESGGGGGEIKALLWYQGESDTSSQHDVDVYKQNMEALIHNVRTDLNLPDLPIVQVALASGVKEELV